MVNDLGCAPEPGALSAPFPTALPLPHADQVIQTDRGQCCPRAVDMEMGYVPAVQDSSHTWPAKT